jgi:hypothetical protein
MAHQQADYYALLGVGRGASAADVDRAYRRAARATHPDVHPDDASAAERFHAVTIAYETLSDPRAAPPTTTPAPPFAKARRPASRSTAASPSLPSISGAASRSPSRSDDSATAPCVPRPTTYSNSLRRFCASFSAGHSLKGTPHEPVRERALEITFPELGAGAYVFTFR